MLQSLIELKTCEHARSFRGAIRMRQISPEELVRHAHANMAEHRLRGRARACTLQLML